MLKSRASIIVLVVVGAAYGVFRLATWPIRSVIHHWPGRRERLLKEGAAQLQRAIVDARQLVAVLAPDLPELQITFGKLLRKSENPWGDAIRLLDKAKRVQGIDSQSDAADLRRVLTSLLSRHGRKLDPGKPAGLQALLSDAVPQLAAMGYVLVHIDEGSSTYVLALCTPDEFAKIEALASSGYSVRRFKPGDEASADPRRFRSDTHQRRQGAGYHEPGPHVPEPIPGRVGWVGGIESLSIDDRRYFFGFSYSDDRVLSPLLEDKRVMAEFAAAYMALMDKVPHDIDYWLELVETAVEHSALCDDESRTLTSTGLHAFAAGLALMQSRNAPSPDLRMDDHLDYLLNACLGDEDKHFLTIGPELERLGLRSGEQEDELDLSELSLLLEIGRGEQPLPSGASFVDVAIVVRDYFKRTTERLPENWSLLYGSFGSNPGEARRS